MASFLCSFGVRIEDSCVLLEFHSGRRRRRREGEKAEEEKKRRREEKYRENLSVLPLLLIGEKMTVVMLFLRSEPKGVNSFVFLQNEAQYLVITFPVFLFFNFFKSKLLRQQSLSVTERRDSTLLVIVDSSCHSLQN